MSWWKCSKINCGDGCTCLNVLENIKLPYVKQITIWHVNILIKLLFKKCCLTHINKNAGSVFIFIRLYIINWTLMACLFSGRRQMSTFQAFWLPQYDLLKEHCFLGWARLLWFFSFVILLYATLCMCLFYFHIWKI